MSIVRSRIERQFQEDWKGLIGIYLFLGGVGAGAYVVAGAGSFLGDVWANVTNAGLYISWPIVIIGMLFLAAHLGVPFKAPLAIVKIGTSWISRGVWVLGIFIVLAFIHFIAVYQGNTVPGILPFFGMLFATFVMLYTGALLSASKGFPLWQTSLLPILFMVSGLVTGMFAVFLAMVAIDSSAIIPDQVRKFAAIGAGLMVIEILAIFFFLHTAWRYPNSREAAQKLVSKPSFIVGDLILGLGLPIVLCLSVYFGMSNVDSMVTAMTVASIFGLIGGFLLRLGILSSGMQTTLQTSGFSFRPIARLDFQKSPIGKLPPQ
jgi:polysulfide reductase chain C